MSQNGSRNAVGQCRLTLERLAGKTSQKEIGLQAQGVTVQTTLVGETARVNRLERGCAAEAEKEQQMLAERRETSQIARRQLADGEEFLQGLQSKAAVATTKINKWHELAAEAVDELKVAQTDVVLQSVLQ